MFSATLKNVILSVKEKDCHPTTGREEVEMEHLQTFKKVSRLAECLSSSKTWNERQISNRGSNFSVSANQEATKSQHEGESTESSNRRDRRYEKSVLQKFSMWRPVMELKTHSPACSTMLELACHIHWSICFDGLINSPSFCNLPSWDDRAIAMKRLHIRYQISGQDKFLQWRILRGISTNFISSFVLL